VPTSTTNRFQRQTVPLAEVEANKFATVGWAIGENSGAKMWVALARKLRSKDT